MSPFIRPLSRRPVDLGPLPHINKPTSSLLHSVPTPPAFARVVSEAGHGCLWKNLTAQIFVISLLRSPPPPQPPALWPESWQEAGNWGGLVLKPVCLVPQAQGGAPAGSCLRVLET